MVEKIIKNIPGLGPEEEVVIKKLGYGSLAKLRNKSTESSMRKNGSVSAKMLFGEYSKWLLIYGIKSANFFKNCRTVEDKSEVIDNDDVETITGDYIFKKIQEINEFDKTESLKKE